MVQVVHRVIRPEISWLFCVQRCFDGYVYPIEPKFFEWKQKEWCWWHLWNLWYPDTPVRITLRQLEHPMFFQLLVLQVFVFWQASKGAEKMMGCKPLFCGVSRLFSGVTLPNILGIIMIHYRCIICIQTGLQLPTTGGNCAWPTLCRGTGRCACFWSFVVALPRSSLPRDHATIIYKT